MFACVLSGIEYAFQWTGIELSALMERCIVCMCIYKYNKLDTSVSFSETFVNHLANHVNGWLLFNTKC
jgi:hypothetical protein